MRKQAFKSISTVLLFIVVLTSCQKKPEADFNAVSLNANGDNETSIYTKITFQNTTSDGSSYEWNFGDGNTSTETSPEHQYSNPGTYSVELKAYSENGKKVSSATKSIAVNRWQVTRFDFTFGVNPVYWGDSTGCFETNCDTLNARIYIYSGNTSNIIYKSPLMPMGNSSTNYANIQIDTSLYFTNEDWRISFVHEYSSGAGKKFAEYTFNPVLTPDNGYINNKSQHYIGFNSGNVGISLRFYFDKKPE